jgi:lipopolysaccharide heptosyltransferase II
MSNETIVKAITFICRAIDKTLRKVCVNDSFLYSKTAVYPFWHSNEFPMLLSNQGNNVVIMVSLSKDGELLSRILNNFGFLTVRGSSSRGGERALVEIIRYVKKGYVAAFAADGPRGPYHKLKSGVVYCAQKTGIPLVPISCSAKNRITIKKSWDKTSIPLPFSKMVQAFGSPIYVSSEDSIEEKAAVVEKELNKLFEFTEKHYWEKDILKYLEYHPFPKILIVQPSRIGDIIFALPVISAIKKKYPNARISWIVDERCAEILDGNSLLENIFVWDRKQKTYGYYRDLKKRLRLQKFDLSIDLHGLAKSAFLVWLAAAKFKIASSSTNGMREFSWLISKEIKSPKHYHCVERHFETAKYLGCLEKISYHIEIVQSAFDSVREKLLKENKNIKVENIIGVHPGGGWVSRRWDTSKFALLSDRLNRELACDIVLVGGKEGGESERGINDEIISKSSVNITDMTGKLTLKELCAFLKICKVFVGNETGPMHIATALNTQSVAILGPTNAMRTGPYKGRTKIIQHFVECQPCRNRNCDDIKCMRLVTVDEVFAAVKEKYV